MGQGNRQTISSLSLLGGDGDTRKWYITRMSSQIYPQQQWTPGFCLGVKVKSWAGILVDGQVFRIINFLTGIQAIHYVFNAFSAIFVAKHNPSHKGLPLRLQPTMTGWLASLEWKTQSIAMLCSLGLQHSGGRQGTLVVGISRWWDDGKHEKFGRMIMWCHKWSQKEHFGKIIPLFIGF